MFKRKRRSFRVHKRFLFYVSVDCAPEYCLALFILPLKFIIFEVALRSRVFLHAFPNGCFYFPLAKHVGVRQYHNILVFSIIPPKAWMIQIESSFTLFEQVASNSCPKLYSLRKLRVLHQLSNLVVPIFNLETIIINLPVWVPLHIDVLSDNCPELHLSVFSFFIKGGIKVYWFSS